MDNKPKKLYSVTVLHGGEHIEPKVTQFDNLELALSEIKKAIEHGNQTAMVRITRNNY